MKYIQPLGEAEEASYTDGNPVTGVPGSIPVAATFEHCQREIVNAITLAGLTPTGNVVTQLGSAVQEMIQNTTANYAQSDFSNVSGAAVLNKLGSDSITATMLADGQVISGHFANEAITGAKIATGAVSTNSIQDNAITLGKLAHGTAGNVIGFDQAGAPSTFAGLGGGCLAKREVFTFAAFGTSSTSFVEAGSCTFTPTASNSSLYVRVTGLGRRYYLGNGEEDWSGAEIVSLVANPSVGGISSAIQVGAFSGRTRSDGIGSCDDSSFIIQGRIDLTTSNDVPISVNVRMQSGGDVILEDLVMVVDEIRN